MRKPLPDITLIRSMFTYCDALQGLVYSPRDKSSFRSLNDYSIWVSKWCGKKAGTRLCFRRGDKPRYTAIKINKKLYFEHLLVLAWHGVQVPDCKDVDHIDNNPTNNAIWNLRIIDRSLNSQRQSRLGKPSHLMGVRKHQGKWMARATINQKRHFIGYFQTQLEASVKRVGFIEKMRGEKLNPAPRHRDADGNPTLWEPCSKKVEG